MGGRGSGPQRRYSTEQVREAVRAAGGNLAVAAQRLGCNRSTVWRYLHPQRASVKKKGEGER